jgi:gamma-glutamyltranspeptidase
MRLVSGAQDPAWAPGARRLAVSLLDRIHLVTPDGRTAAPLVEWPDDRPVVEREPSWSPDGARLVFAADRGEGFDLFVVPARGGRAERLTFLPGDERCPSWGRDGRIAFAAHDRTQWDLFLVDPDARVEAAPPSLVRLTNTPDEEKEPAVSPDGVRVAFVSNRSSADGDADLWLMELPLRSGATWSPDASGARMTAVLRERGLEARPAWSPDGQRLAFAAMRDGVGTIWVTQVEPIDEDESTERPRPATPPQLLSRRFGIATWGPDEQTLTVAELPEPRARYDGDPLRRSSEAPPVFAPAPAYTLRTLPAPRPPDAGERALPLSSDRADAPWGAMFDRTWGLLRDLYYSRGPSAEEWARLGERLRPLAARSAGQAEFDRVVDGLIAAQPLVNAPVVSDGALVVSGHRLASEVGARVLQNGGNVVDAAVAVSFALGVVEPDASGIGGDGMAIVWLTSMDEPVVVDFKDQSPMRATLDNPRIFRDGRLVGDGPAAVNVPGVVAGMDLLHQRFGSRRQNWQDLVAPSAALAEEGFVLDEALPTTLAEGRPLLAKYAGAARVFLPGGRVPRAGERFSNRDLAATLRVIAKDGAAAFYRGSIARRIADDMAAHGGILTYEDLAQYRAIERVPLRGAFRGHTVYSSPPPVPAGAGLIEVLQVLHRYSPSPGASYFTDADLLHLVIEAWKIRDPIQRVADPALWPIDLGDHLSGEHAAGLFRRIDMRKAGGFPVAREPEPANGDDRTGDRLGRGTTAFVVADHAGNVVAVTQTLSTWGGSFYVSDGLGFLYNNHLRGYRTTPGAYGQLLPLMRSSSTALPTLVFRDGPGGSRPRLAVAAAGNAWIAPAVAQIILNVIDAGLPVQRAIEAPRFLVARDPSDGTGARARVLIEDRLPSTIVRDLAQRGHVLQRVGRKGELKYGYAAAVTIDAEAGRLEAGTEPRRSHHAVAVPR